MGTILSLFTTGFMLYGIYKACQEPIVRDTVRKVVNKILK